MRAIVDIKTPKQSLPFISSKDIFSASEGIYDVYAKDTEEVQDYKLIVLRAQPLSKPFNTVIVVDYGGDEVWSAKPNSSIDDWKFRLNEAAKLQINIL